MRERTTRTAKTQSNKVQVHDLFIAFQENQKMKKKLYLSRNPIPGTPGILSFHRYTGCEISRAELELRRREERQNRKFMNDTSYLNARKYLQWC